MKRDNNYLMGNQCANGNKPNKTSFIKGQTPWNKGLTGQEYKEHFENGFKGTFPKGIHPATEFKERNVPWHSGTKGLYKSPRKDKSYEEQFGIERVREFKKKLSIVHKGLQAKENHPNWKGGISLSYKIRIAERDWWEIAKQIRRRDNYQCQLFGELGYCAHHIIPYSKGRSDEFLNLITLCKRHHGKIEQSKFQSFWRYYLSKHIKTSMN